VRINPQGIYAYFDKITVWLRQPISYDEQKWISQQCGKGGLHVHNRFARFDRLFTQRLQLRQPNREVLLWLAKRNDAHLNYVEFSLDWTFPSENLKDEAWQFVCQYQLKKYHREHGIRFVAGVTRYTGPRSAPNVLAIYCDKPCRLTGEVYCTHLDWRMKGAATLRRVGIFSVADLLNFDHRLFWSTRMLFHAIAPDKLGRIYWNHHRKSKRRGRWVVKSKNGFIYDIDARTGGTIMRALGSTQAVVDEWRKHFDVNRCLVPIDHQHLLPGPRDEL
jgi:hypothetical protein